MIYWFIWQTKHIHLLFVLQITNQGMLLQVVCYHSVHLLHWTYLALSSGSWRVQSIWRVSLKTGTMTSATLFSVVGNSILSSTSRQFTRWLHMALWSYLVMVEFLPEHKVVAKSPQQFELYCFWTLWYFSLVKQHSTCLLNSFIAGFPNRLMETLTTATGQDSVLLMHNYCEPTWIICQIHLWKEWPNRQV